MLSMIETDPPSFFDKAAPDGTSRLFLNHIVAEIQDFFLSENKDPVEVFRLYGLQYTKQRTLKQKQLKYWIKYLKDYNGHNKTNSKTLFEVMKKMLSP